MQTTCITLVIGIILICSTYAEVTSYSRVRRPTNMTLSDEKRVIKYLLDKYSIAGKGGRPVINSSIPTVVQFGLGLIQLDLDEKKKIFTTSMWSRLSWEDSYLTWDPGDFGGVTSVRIDCNQVWIPDIMLYNTADPEAKERNALVTITYDGVVNWVPHNIFKSSCSINVVNFPFDSQKCHMWFGSWTYAASAIDMKMAYPGGIDLGTFQSDYKETCSWEIMKPVAERRLLPPNDTNPVAVLCFTLHMQRKLVFSSYILTLPCIFLASLTMVVFWLPPERPDRTGLAMALFSSFLLLLLLLVEASPPTASSIPLLGVYYCFNMVIIMLSIFISSMIVNINRGGDNKRKVPAWLRVLTLNLLGRLMCVSPFTRKPRAAYQTSRSYKPADIRDDEDVQRILTIRRDSDSAFRHIQEHHSSANNTNEVAEKTSNSSVSSKIRVLERNLSRLDLQVGDVKRALDNLLENTLAKEALARELHDIKMEWKLVALALDRFFFFVYLAAIVISLFTLFPRPPGWW